MNTNTSFPSSALLVLELNMTEHAPATYSLSIAANQCGVHPALVLHYCRIGLLGPALAQPEGEPVFNDDTLFELRRVEHYRRHHGIERRTLRLLCGLWHDVDRLESELRLLRAR
jgi:DNA-binding transcriptional MerR regulator